MVAALSADAVAVCFESWMNQSMARPLLNSSKCKSTNGVMELALNYGPVLA